MSLTSWASLNETPGMQEFMLSPGLLVSHVKHKKKRANLETLHWQDSRTPLGKTEIAALFAHFNRLNVFRHYLVWARAKEISGQSFDLCPLRFSSSWRNKNMKEPVSLQEFRGQDDPAFELRRIVGLLRNVLTEYTVLSRLVVEKLEAGLNSKGRHTGLKGNETIENGKQGLEFSIDHLKAEQKRLLEEKYRGKVEDLRAQVLELESKLATACLQVSSLLQLSKCPSLCGDFP